MKNGRVSAPFELPKDRNWPKDEFGQSEVAAQLSWWVIPVIALLASLLLPLMNAASAGRENRVVVYCAQDQVYAEPIFRDFEKQTGIKIGAVYDSEAVKTVGLANRLLAERLHPQCDVFWGNEEMRARQLAAQDTFRQTNGWAAFGFRSRRIVINTNRLTWAAAPKSLLELTNSAWRGKWRWLTRSSVRPPRTFMRSGSIGAALAGRPGAARSPPIGRFWWTAIPWL